MPDHFTIVMSYRTEAGVELVCLKRANTATDTGKAQCDRMVKLLLSLGFEVVVEEQHA